MDKKLLGACGINCGNCDAYKATMAKDEAWKKEIAEKWSQGFGQEMTPEMVTCESCMQGETVIGFGHQCKVRLCAKEKGLNHCAECADFPCSVLNDWHAHMKNDAKDNLLEARAAIS
ncbi:MAG TPA: DUF3795 domain-containing protein [Candidatus Cloacimonadota bacterium]|nr:DUF3795 domain-containing protein [Candidatus Cloacimonadota bacterium]HPT72193.1 DUF3795 domain-containing protein [Candidatus Cloacimonadota bacterium]